LADRRDAVDAMLERLRAASVAERANLFVPSRPPLWRSGFGAELRRELPDVPEKVRSYARGTRAYVERDPRPLVVQLLLAALLMIGFRRLSARAPERLGSSRATRLLERPYSSGLLFALLASPALHPLAPRRFMQLLGTVALLPAARIAVHATGRANLAAFAGAFVLLLLDRLALALAPLPAVARASFLMVVAIAFGLAFWLARRARRAGDPAWMRRAAELATLGLALALLAEVGGWANLAALLGRGIVASAIVALYVYAGTVSLEPVLVYVSTSPTLRRSHLFERNTAALQRSVERGLRWLGAGLWLYLVLRAVGLRNSAADALRALLQVGVSVGALSLSLGAVLAFLLTLLAALLLARIVNGVLEEDVYPRTSLPRGIPHALSAMVRYGAYSLGFLLALAAAGVQLSQLTILLGGLGVGIGLGLQDLVKNFAAGLTLLLERRVHVGDALNISSQEIFGRVLSIGMRATVVRNWNGSEVVVPNGDLISGAVTNWTLSDRLCRIEFPVGVAYGTDPERVVALLLDVARANAHVLPRPDPQALFKGFGDSSLDFLLRVWTDVEYERILPLTSELALAVHRSLYGAGIEIPFPQRDLHLASVSPEVRAAFSNPSRDAGRDRATGEVVK
jgi:potassium efflux system protein